MGVRRVERVAPIATTETKLKIVRSDRRDGGAKEPAHCDYYDYYYHYHYHYYYYYHYYYHYHYYDDYYDDYHYYHYYCASTSSGSRSLDTGGGAAPSGEAPVHRVDYSIVWYSMI